MTANYKLIENYIIKNIENGNFKIGDQIPTEKNLAEKFNVSRMTVNKALSSLANKRIINRISGKGSFVSKVRFDKQIKSIPQSFTEDMKKLGLIAGSKLIDYMVIKGEILENEIKKTLGANDNDLFHYFRRIRTGNDTKICLSCTYIPCSVVDSIDISALHNSLYTFLEKKGYFIDSMDLSIEAIKATHEQEELLDIKNEALLKVSHLSYLADGRLIEFNQTYYIGNMYVYKTKL